MSVFRYSVEIGDPQGSRFERVETLVDTVVPKAMLRGLGVPVQRTARFRLANGSVVEGEIGETKIRLETVMTLVVLARRRCRRYLASTRWKQPC